MELYDTLSVSIALVVLITVLVYTAARARRERQFLVTTFPLWMVLALLWNISAPLVYRAASTIELSYSDAYFLRHLYVGWRHVLVAHGLLIGVATGGVIGFLFRHRGN